MMPSRERISAFVVSYNRGDLLGTCLRSLRFADELIVVDKSSQDAAPAIAASLADRVVTVPWSPTVEETRSLALSLCSHDWIVFADDDECFSAELAAFIETEVGAPRAEVFALPLRHYILGRHDERAYYWPEHHVRFFRRGSVGFRDTVHAGVAVTSHRLMQVPATDGICIHHLSHPDVASWIERTNRYTSRPDRAHVGDAEPDLIGFAHARIDHWAQRTRDTSPAGYPAAVAVLRAVYDLVDRLKLWEAEDGQDGYAAFADICRRLDAQDVVPVVSQDPVVETTTLYRARRDREMDALLAQLADETAALQALRRRVDDAECRVARLTDELGLARGSLRHFLRSYLPRLWRHLVGVQVA